MSTRSSAIVSILNGITALAVLIALYVALVYAPPAANLVGAAQIAQRIFYFHVPSAWVGLKYVSSIIGLRNRGNGPMKGLARPEPISFATDTSR